jgi:hypothetical protein
LVGKSGREGFSNLYMRRFVIAKSLRFEMENRSITLFRIIRIGGFDRRPSPRIGQTSQSINVNTLLISAQCSGGATKTSWDIVLIRISRLKERNHCIGFRGVVGHVVMSKKQCHARKSLASCPRFETIRDHLQSSSRPGAEQTAVVSFVLETWRLACQTISRFKKRTVLAPHPCPQKWSFSWNFGYHVRSSEIV